MSASNLLLRRNILSRTLQILKRGTSSQKVQASAPAVTALSRQLNAKIKLTGPITVAEYMKEVLVNPTAGYYPTKDGIGPQGDFITSPELNQIFGEMLALWVLNEWQKVGSPKPMQLVELGPGKGTLMSDILRVFKHFKVLDQVSVHMVELSQVMRETQAKLLCSEAILGKASELTSGTTVADCPIHWHHHISEVPKDAFCCVLAHEFFDALPVHKLRKTAEGWREILIDIDPDSENIQFRFIIAREDTPASKLYAPKDDLRNNVEVSPESGSLIQSLAKRFEEDGGFFLMADYGHNGDKEDTLRGFSNHQLHDPILNPGSADLTADVDFRYLKNCIGDKALTFGPVAQEEFLNKLGIQVRLEILLKNENLSSEHKEILKSGVDMMTNPTKMGQRFQFFSIFPTVLKSHLEQFPVLGFPKQ